MSQYILFFVLGLSVGSVYASLSCGIVLTYQGTGVINFAAAAMATVPLYVYSELELGRLTLPLPWFPSWDVNVPTWAEMVIALLVAAALGALVQVAVSRPLRTAPVLAKVVAAVGAMLTLQAGLALKFGTEPRPRTALLPTGTVKISGANVGVDRLWFIALVVVLSSAPPFWSRLSGTGLSIRAAAENERAASFARLSPQRLGMVTWVLATVFMSFIAIMAGPAIGILTPSNLTLLVVPALAGALVARLQSIWLALLGSLGLGVLQSELQFLSSTKDWWPEWGKQGLSDAVPFLVIVIVLFILGRSIPMRGEDIRSSLPPVIIPRNRPAVIAVLCVVGVLVVTLTSGSYRYGVITSLAATLIALSLVVLTGMVGQISLAQAAFAGVAGLALTKFGTGVPFPLSLILAALVATVAGVLVGLPALRIRGAQLAVVTLAAAITLEKFVFGNPQILKPTLNLIPNPRLFGMDLSIRKGRDIARVPFGIFVLIVVVIAFILVCNLMRAGSGRKMLAVSSNARGASWIGIGVASMKLGAFAISSFLAGLGGGLIGYSRGQLSPESFGTFVGLSILATAYLGGITSASGAIVPGAIGVLGIVYVIFDRNLNLGNYYALFSGVSLILTVVLNPVGIAGKSRADFEKFKAKQRAKKGIKEAEPPTLGEELAVSTNGEAPAPAVAATNGAAAKREIGEVLLRTDNVSVTYGGLRAVSDVTIEVRAGEIVGLIGPNGAGKTSFIDAITGFTQSTGEVQLHGEPITELSAYKRARKGLVRTWQSVELFDDLSAENNVRVSDDIGKDGWKLLRDTIRPNPPPSAAVREAIALMGLTDVADRHPSELPLGRQKALGVARSLAMKRAVLLPAGPAAGLDTAESVAFGEHLKEIAGTGVGCLLVDHDMHLVLGVCDRIYVIEFGRQIASGPPEVVRRDPAVVAAYLGSENLGPETVSAAP